MGKILKRFSIGAVAVLLAVSILFCNVTERYYAMESAITYTTWQLWTMVFASLGITIDRVGTLSDEERISEMEATVLDYMDSLEDVETTPLEEARDFVCNIGDYVVDGALTISDSVFDLLRGFFHTRAVEPLPVALPPMQEISNILSSWGYPSLKEYLIFYAKGSYYCVVGDSFVYADTAQYNTNVMVNRMEGVKYIPYFYILDGHWKSGTNASYPQQYVDAYYYSATDFSIVYTSCNIYDSSGILRIPAKEYSEPSFAITPALDSFSDVFVDDAYDVLTPGREYDDKDEEVTGDVVLPVPGSSVFDKFENGEITWEEFLEELGVEPIDTTKGTDLLTGEFLDTQTGILSGVNSILDGVASIVKFLEGLIEKLVTAFLDMLLSLVIPADGFIEGKIGELQNKLNSLGIAPYDMGNIFDDGDGNPFKDITAEISGQEVVIVSFAYLPKFLTKFRPVIRGLLVLFLLYYSINQLLSLLRLSGVMEGGNSSPIQIGVGTGANVPQLSDKGGR